MRTLAIALTMSLFTLTSVASEMPAPKEGLLISKNEAEKIREKVINLEEHPLMKRVKEKADEAENEWKNAKPEIEKHLDQLLDIVWENNPNEYVPESAMTASKLLYKMIDDIPSVAFMYFLTDDKHYAQLCYEIIDMAGRVPRWGWFNWGGANMPQIHYGIITHDIAVTIDWCWDGWDKQQKDNAINIIAEKGVESYWRIVNHTPFMGLHHLRSKNQGNNALSAALMASIVVGDSIPENKVWMDTLIHSFSWIVTCDIGWAGQGLESGLSGYWSVSMQNLYTAAVALYNSRGIDFRIHPGFDEATYYPLYLEATVPPTEQDQTSESVEGSSSIIGNKPIELPQRYGGSSWWFDYASHFPDSPASYYVAKIWNGRIEEAHQAGMSYPLMVLWVALAGKPEKIPYPTKLFRTTDRMTMFRSGYGSPHTYLYFNGDIFLSSRNEILCTTSGLSWHFPWDQYAITESVLETESNPLSPSMLVTDYFDSDSLSMIKTKSWASNLKYYIRPGQNESYKDYKSRNRDIIYVRSKDRNLIYDYFLFIDDVEQDQAKWHSFNWHIWNSPENEGKYEILSPNMAIGRRPKADILLATLSHDKMSYEMQGIPSQPIVSYVMDHNALLLRAIAGGIDNVNEETKVIPVELWSDGKAMKIDGINARYFQGFKELRPKLEGNIQLMPDARYKISVKAKKQDARVYENFAWKIDFTLLDKDGKVIQKVQTQERDPDPLRLTDPASFQPDYDWLETITYFDAPANVSAIVAELLPATWVHQPHELKPESKLWLSDITITPMGVPVRKEKDMIVTLAVPLPKNAEIPKIISKHSDEGIEATLTHPDGTQDAISVNYNGDISVKRNGEVIQIAKEQAENQLMSNSTESQARLRQGLRKLTETAIQERDKYTIKGWKNIALDAEVTASASRDPRFPPSNVIDNRTWEFPSDGKLDYTLGEIQTTQGFGYGKDEKMSYTDNMSSWPFYIPPTYWLLPYRQTGEITLKLKESSKIKMIRVLNTSNAGLFDYGTIDFRIDLLDENGNKVFGKESSFGKVWDRAFKSAFVKPEFFSAYGPTFEGILEPGVKVPYGNGWQDIEIGYTNSVRYVRLSILSYWALGGGINEIQVYIAIF